MEIEYQTRRTGRTGNQLFEYLYWTLKAIKDKKKFSTDFNFPRPFNHFEKKRDIVNVDIKFDYKDERYPMNIKEYIPHIPFLKKLLKVPDFPASKYDVVIHIRLDDVGTNNGEYRLLSPKFYQSCLEKIQNKSTILIIGHAINDVQINYLKVLSSLISCWYPTSKIDINYDTSIEKDLIELMKAKILIGSSSSFWAIPVLFSNNIQRIYLTDFGMINKMKFLEHPLAINVPH